MEPYISEKVYDFETVLNTIFKSELGENTEIKHRLEQCIELLKEKYVSVYEIDLEKDTFTTLYYNSKLTGSAIPVKGCYSVMNEKYLNGFVHPQFKEERIRIGRICNIREFLKENKRYEYEYKSLKLPENIWMRVAYHVEEYKGGMVSKILMTHSCIVKTKAEILNVEEEKDIRSYQGTLSKRILTQWKASFGLKGRDSFFELAEEKIKSESDNLLCMCAIDIEHFRLFNKWFGRSKGDMYLQKIADYLKKVEDEYDGIAGYFGGDNFALLLPAGKSVIKKIEKELKSLSIGIGRNVGFLPAIGIYRIEKDNLSVSMMYDCSQFALSHVIGKYEKRYCYYTSDMTDKIEEELRMILEIKNALEKKHFTFYVQPKCQISTGKVIGAEALVRWIDPEKGLISPNEFIPILEKNGLISELDRFTWNLVCKWLRKWLDDGHQAVPISINISRIDIMSMNVVDYLVKLTDRYHLDHKLLKVEITESAYTDNEKKIRSTVEGLRDAGFFVLMDDFGSGYSSLNMLHSVKVDTIKMDMRFLNIAEEDKEKGINILNSMVTMSKSMGLPVIIEGVETKEQEQYLRDMGCRYAQGYLYYRPMPVTDYEKLILDEEKIETNIEKL